MTTTMSMRERREKIEQLVQQNPRVQACSNTFNEAQAHISQWHEHNDALCATNGALNELDELLTYSEAALDDLKRAKTTTYNQLMSQYPRVWDTNCADPFDAGTQGDATDTGAETEEMEEVPTPTPLIPLDAIIDLLDERRAFYAGYQAYQEERGHADGYELGLLRATKDITRRLRDLHVPIVEAGVPEWAPEPTVGEAIDQIRAQREETHP